MDEEPEIEWQVEEEIDLADYAEKDGPPEVSGEQLEMLDKEAMLEEVEKLKNMEVISSIPTDMAIEDALQLLPRMCLTGGFDKVNGHEDAGS